MKRYLLAAGVALAIAAAAIAREQSMLARVTVYWASGGSGSDKWTSNHQAATKVRLHSGHCAVDPRKIPYGSKVTLPDGTLVAVDTGKHVKTRRAARVCGRSAAERKAIVIDRFFETKAQALAWANHNPQFMTVRVDLPNEPAAATAAVATTRVTKVAATKLTQQPKPVMLVTRTEEVSAPPVNAVAGSAPQVPPAPTVFGRPTLLLRNSVTTPRTPRVAALPQPTSTSAPLRAMRVAPASANPKVAQPLLASAEPSHYGRAVAYLP